MVRHRWERDRRGKLVWAEISPEACPAGHTRLGAAWGPCTVCGEMGREWRCQECDAIMFDDEHVHREQRTPPDSWRL